ncbi:MAG: Nif3-like dinuclear metal center hexameric protein [Gammaproteobacteria bacterium]|nr:Nif3-like dinuclear metal center hexameric protein [Gammaproteobacteria bacterium]
MASLQQLVEYCDTLLGVADYQDYAPNGLQVEGRGEVRRIVSGVTASQALIEAAIERQADLLLVHHGYFWKGESPVITGIKQRRIRALLAHNISLLAYHLPLDGHAALGNNAQLGRLLGITVEGRFGSGPGGGIAMWGTFSQPLSPADLAARLGERLGREPLLLEGDGRPVRRIGWCSGGAEGYLEQAAALGLDAYISGELAEPTMHIARELGIHYLAAGHHATERYGVQALGDHLADHFAVENYFVDLPNPA